VIQGARQSPSLSSSSSTNKADTDSLYLSLASEERAGTSTSILGYLIFCAALNSTPHIHLIISCVLCLVGELGELEILLAVAGNENFVLLREMKILLAVAG
jgi:hypothetical protein